MLWDTAGQEEFDAITKAYYRGAQACVLAFSMTDRDSFEAIHSWKIKVFFYFTKSYLLVVRLILIISDWINQINTKFRDFIKTYQSWLVQNYTRLNI